MATLHTDERCTLHPDRGAKARCPSCGYFFCGECITEHEGRLVCASCLAGEHEESSAQPAKRRLRLPTVPFWAAVQILVAVLIVWMGFLFLAETLRNTPDRFHEGTLWR
jgi:hypothetical protein